MSQPKEPSKRRGRAKKSDGESPAEFQSGGAQKPRVFDAASVAEELSLWWENGGGTNYILGDGAGWSVWPEKKILNLLKTKYVRLKPREGEVLSEAEQVILHTMQQRRVEMVLDAIAGHPAGIYVINGKRVLVKTSPRLIEPCQGEWETVKAVIHSKLDFGWSDDEGHGVDQTIYFHGWMKIALEALYLGGPGNFRPGQSLVFAGPKDCGKSRIQHQIITGLLGGRSADPGPYLFGRTDFNAEMFAAEHLMMEDPASSTKTVDRVYFGEQLKQLVVNDTQRLHEKRENALTLSPFFRTTISINDDPDKMRVLPLLTPDMKDKLMLFLVSPAPLPMPTTTLDERAAFRARVAEELPAYAWWLLNEFQIPEDYKSARFGVREWHHPTLTGELFDDTPASEFMQLVDAAVFTTAQEGEGLKDCKLWELPSDAKGDVAGKAWDGTAIELERLLIMDSCSVSREVKRFVAHNKVDRVLGRLKEDAPRRVVYARKADRRAWVIYRPS